MNARQKAKHYKKMLLKTRAMMLDMFKEMERSDRTIYRLQHDIIKVEASMTVDTYDLEYPSMEYAIRRGLMHRLADDETFKQLVEFVSHRDELTMKTTIHASLRGIKPRLEDEDDDV